MRRGLTKSRKCARTARVSSTSSCAKSCSDFGGLVRVNHGAAACLDDYLVIFDRKHRDAVFIRILFDVTAHGPRAEQRLQHRFGRGSSSQGHLRDLKILGIAIFRGADGELPIQKTPAESHFLERITNLNTSDIILDVNERLAPELAFAGDELVNIVGGQL